MQITYYAMSKMQRVFPIEAALLKWLYNILSMPKMALEVFSRQSFGERYFSMPISVFLIILLSVLPVSFPTTDKYSFSFWQMIGANLSWYIYVVGFAYMAILRRIEIQHDPSVFDFAKHSLFDGKHQKWFQTLVLDRLGKLNPRLIDIWIEPGFFFISGIAITIVISPFIGAWIIFCALCYMLANQISYIQGDHMMMNWMDISIEAEQIEKVLVENRPASETKGLKFNGRRPTSKKHKKAVANMATATAGDMRGRDGKPIDWDWLKNNAFDEDGNPSLNYYNKI